MFKVYMKNEETDKEEKGKTCETVFLPVDKAQ